MVVMYLSPIITIVNYLCRCCKMSLNKKSDLLRTKKIFERAEKNYFKELDIIELVKKVRDAESFRRLFLNQQQ